MTPTEQTVITFDIHRAVYWYCQRDYETALSACDAAINTLLGCEGGERWRLLYDWALACADVAASGVRMLENVRRLRR